MCPDCTHGTLARQATLAGVKRIKTSREVLEEGHTTASTHKPKPLVDQLLAPDRDEALDLDEELNSPVMAELEVHAS